MPGESREEMAEALAFHGFDKSDCMRILEIVDDDVERAAEVLLLERQEGRAGGKASAAAGGDSAAAGGDGDAAGHPEADNADGGGKGDAGADSGAPDGVSTLMAMGFDAAACKRALRLASGNVEKAAEALSRRPTKRRTLRARRRNRESDESGSPPNASMRATELSVRKPAATVSEEDSESDAAGSGVRTPTAASRRTRELISQAAPTTPSSPGGSKTPGSVVLRSARKPAVSLDAMKQPFKAPKRSAKRAITGKSHTVKGFTKMVESAVESFDDSEFSTWVGGGASGTGKDHEPKLPIDLPRMKKLANGVASLSSQGLLNEVDITTLVDLNRMLHSFVLYGKGIRLENDSVDGEDVEDGDGAGGGAQAQSSSDRLLHAMVSSEAAIAVVQTMCDPSVDRRMLSEDIILDCVQLCRHHLQAHIFQEASPSPSKSARTPRKATTNSAQLRRLADEMAELLGELGKLCEHVNLQDSALLELVRLALSSFTIDGSDSLEGIRLNAILVVQCIFRKHEHLRPVCIDELLDTIIHVPQKSRLRQFVVRDKCRIQVVSAVAMSFVQSAVHERSAEDIAHAVEANLEADGDTPQAQRSSRSRTPTGVDGALAVARLISGALVDRCIRNENADAYRTALKNFTMDLREVLGSVEWPGAEPLLHATCTLLCTLLPADGKKLTAEMHSISQLSATMLGEILARVFALVGAKDDNPLRLPSNATELDDDRKETYCICMSSDEDGFMIACGKCERWYHGSCIGIEQAGLAPDVWHCDDCTLESTVRSIAATSVSRQLKVGGLSPAKRARRTNEDVLSSLEPDQLKSVEDVALKQLAINHLNKFARSADVLVSARRCLISQWSDDAIRGGDAGEATLLSSQWTLPRESVHADQEPVVGGSSMSKIALRLFAATPIVRDSGKFFRRMLDCMDFGGANLRYAATRSLSSTIAADARLMQRPRVQQTVQLRFQDDSVKVREAALDLVGSYIISHSQLIPLYITALLACLRDPGVSVRKRIVKIADTLLSRRSISELELDAASKDDMRFAVLQGLLRRVSSSSEEESVKRMVSATFEKLWFSLVESSDSSGNTMVTPAQLEERAMQIVALMCDAMMNGGSTEWLAPMLVRLVRDDGDGMPDSESDSEDDHEAFEAGRNVHEAVLSSRSRRGREVCRRLVNVIVDHIQDMSLRKVTVPPRIPKSRVSEWFARQFVAAMTCLRTFIDVRPSLLVTHVRSISTFLKGEELLSQKAQSAMLRELISAIDAAMPLLKRYDESVLDSMEVDLITLIESSFSPPVVQAASSCAARLVSVVGRPPARLVSVLEDTMTKLQEQVDASDDDRSGASRTDIERWLYSLGCLGRYFDFDSVSSAVLSGTALSRGGVLEAMCNVYMGFVTEGAKGLQGLDKTIAGRRQAVALIGWGHLCVRKPRLLLEPTAQKVVEQAFRHVNQSVRRDMLNAFTTLLRAEQDRNAAGLKSRKSAETEVLVSGDQDPDAAVMTGVVQLHFDGIRKLLFDQVDSVRLAAVKLLGLILAHGLVNPRECVAPLVALQTDRAQLIRETALQHFEVLREKYPSFVEAQLFEGVCASFTFQQMAFGHATAFDGKGVLLLGPMYERALRGKIRPRNNFLSALVGCFQQSKDSHGKRARQAGRTNLRFLKYIAELLSALPYNKEQEVLFVVHCLNRHGSLEGQDIVDVLSPLVGESSDHKDLERLLKQQSPKATKVLEFSARAVAASWLLRLKQFLKIVFSIGNDSAKVFSVTTKDQEKTVHRLADQHLECPDAPEALLSTKAAAHAGKASADALRVVFSEFHSLMRGDPIDFAFDFATKVQSAKAKRRQRSSKARPPRTPVASKRKASGSAEAPAAKSKRKSTGGVAAANPKKRSSNRKKKKQPAPVVAASDASDDSDSDFSG